MDKYSYFKNLNLDKEIVQIIENDIFLENYLMGEEIFNPETPINKVSIILSGSIRQIKRDSTKNTNIYKYVKNDLLFIPELIYELKNSFYYIAANDLQLISIEKEKFLSLLKENNEFRKWINNQIFKNEKISILQKLLKEEFNNNLDKEQLLNNLSKNLRIFDKEILNDIQDKKIESKNFEIYSISKSNKFNYLEKLSLEKILELNKDHKIVKELKKRIDADENDVSARDITTLLYDVSLLRSGFTMEDPKQFSNRICRMIELGLNLNDDDVESISEEQNETVDEPVMEQVD